MTMQKRKTRIHWLLPALLAASPSSWSAEANVKLEGDKKGDVLVVTAKPAEDSPNPAGAGMSVDTVELGPLGKRDRIDTPYSNTTVTSAMIANQQAKNVNDLLKYSASAHQRRCRCAVVLMWDVRNVVVCKGMCWRTAASMDSILFLPPHFRSRCWSGWM